MIPVITVILPIGSNVALFELVRFVLLKRLSGEAQIVVSTGTIEGAIINIQGGLFDIPDNLAAIEQHARDIVRAIMNNPILFVD